ncbi:MAG: tetratricopeptide repeat protein [Acidobacteriota bacterium]
MLWVRSLTVTAPLTVAAVLTVAAALLTALVASGWAAPPNPCTAGSEALGRRDLPAAERLLKECLSREPARQSAFVELAAVYQAQGNTAALQALARQGLKRFPNEPRFHLTVGIHAGREGRFDEAVDVLAAGLRRWPADSRFQKNLVDAYVSRGLAALDEGSNEAAERDLSSALKLDASQAEAWLNVGRALHNLNRSVESMSAFERALKVDPRTPLAEFHRGMVSYTLRDYDQAIAALSREIERNPDYPPAYQFRGLARMFKAQWSEAVADLAIAAGKMPGDAEVLYALGRCLNQLGQMAEAEAAFRKTIELSPSSPRAYYSLGRLLSDDGRAPEAQELFDKAAALHATARVAAPGEIRFKSLRTRKP